MKVRDPEGRTWRVTRRWLPWRPRPRAWSPSLSRASVLRIRSVAEAIERGDPPRRTLGVEDGLPDDRPETPDDPQRAGA